MCQAPGEPQLATPYQNPLAAGSKVVGRPDFDLVLHAGTVVHRTVPKVCDGAMVVPAHMVEQQAAIIGLRWPLALITVGLTDLKMLSGTQ